MIEFLTGRSGGIGTPYWRPFYHLVWATKNREPWIDQRHHDGLLKELRAIINDHRAIVHAIGIMPNHIHVVISIPPSVSISKVVGSMKGSSSRFLNILCQPGRSDSFAWQDEYSVHSFAEKNLPDVIKYVNNQPAHHAANRTWAKLACAASRD
ncbi:MAG: IS200/IS605 family transposase [Thermomicrobiales bacterium]